MLCCVCHSFAFCGSHAVLMLPPFLESLLKEITSYFSCSSKRQNDFTIIQDIVKVVHHRIPKLAQTRWLLEQWEALVLYFQTNSKTDLVFIIELIKYIKISLIVALNICSVFSNTFLEKLMLT